MAFLPHRFHIVFRIVIICIPLLLFIHLYQRAFGPGLYSWIIYKLRQKSFTPCSFRKMPFIQILDNMNVKIFWETTCELEEIEFAWNLVPLELDGLGRPLKKQLISKTGQKYSMASLVENRIGKLNMNIVKLGKRHTLYSVQLESLSPECLCEYQIRLSSKHAVFKSAFPILPDSTSQLAPPVTSAINPVEIVIVSDSRDSRRQFGEICHRINDNEPHLFIHLGGLVKNAHDKYDWETGFFDLIGSFSPKTPGLVTNGAATDFGLYFESDDKKYYSVSIGAARWMILDAANESEEQVSWLEAELLKAHLQKTPFKIVICHIPPFVEFWDRKGWDAKDSIRTIFIRTRLVPLFEKYRVDLVLSGYQKNYQRGIHNGVNYVITGGSGGRIDRHRVDDYAFYKKVIFDNHFLLLRLSRESIHIQVRSTSDKLLDSFHIPRTFARKMKPSEMLSQ